MISVSFAAKRLMEKRMKFSEIIQQMYPPPLAHFSGDLPRIIKSNALYLLLIHLQGIRQLTTVPGVQKKKKKIEAEYHEHTIIREVGFSFLTLCGASLGPQEMGRRWWDPRGMAWEGPCPHDANAAVRGSSSTPSRRSWRMSRPSHSNDMRTDWKETREHLTRQSLSR